VADSARSTPNSSLVSHSSSRPFLLERMPFTFNLRAMSFFPGSSSLLSQDVMRKMHSFKLDALRTGELMDYSFLLGPDKATAEVSRIFTRPQLIFNL